ncbi:Trp biosynthesis-associated membrane protein [Glaciibacter sp. 2TAF33]|uniref:Trp biosynthesis-associated membrane protein n=1 Tax=Glaciibacter sp. 2TAF33 TaxID=3233015 RepID=UPI003F8FFB6A
MSAVAPDRRGRRVKLLLVVTVIGASALALLAWTQTWVDANVIIQGSATTHLAVTGSTAAPAVTALALAGLALAGALTIAGPVIRIVLGALEVLLGGSVFLAAISAVVDPAGASAAAVTAATGIAGHESIQGGVASAALTGWPYLALAAAVIMVVAGIGVLATQHRWPGPTARYQAVRLVPAATDAAPGEAPAGSAGAARGNAAPASAGAATPAGASPGGESAAGSRDSVGDWDDLSRGEDPTA